MAFDRVPNGIGDGLPTSSPGLQAFLANRAMNALFGNLSPLEPQQETDTLVAIAFSALRHFSD